MEENKLNDYRPGEEPIKDFLGNGVNKKGKPIFYTENTAKVARHYDRKRRGEPIKAPRLGRPKTNNGTKNFIAETRLLRRYFLEKCVKTEDMEAIYEELMKMALNNNPQQLQAIKLWFSYVIGNPDQNITIDDKKSNQYTSKEAAIRINGFFNVYEDQPAILEAPTIESNKPIGKAAPKQAE